MTSSANSLYQKTLLDHHKNPRNFGELERPDGSAEGSNPLCGDRFRVDVALSEGRVQAVAFSGKGCAVARAAASIMTEVALGKTPDELAELHERFRQMVQSDPDSPVEEGLPELLVALSSLRRYPVRVPCALFPWAALMEVVNHTER